MAYVKGFRLIDYDEAAGTLNYLLCEDGMVDQKPAKKWRYEKVNPVDPTDVWRIGPYYVDGFSCKVPLTPEQYAALKDFICNAVELRIEFNHGKEVNGDWITKQYIITTIKSLPDVPDDLHEFKAMTKFSLEAVYTAYASLVGDGDVYSEDELVIE